MRCTRTVLVCLILTYLIKVTLSAEIKTRRIINGYAPNSKIPFMAYLLKTDQAKVQYDAWICGGTIVHPSFILTSAACIEDVQFMYAIVGYDKYVNSKNINSDKCTKKYKKKIVFTCVPKLYEFSYENTTKWGTADIAMAKTESPINFQDRMYFTSCSYVPEMIEINYDMKYQAPGTDGIIYGWGHTEKFRKEEDTKDYNNNIILETSVLIVNKNVCKKYWPKHWHSSIDKYMICSEGAGNLNGNGSLILNRKPVNDGCSADGRSGPSCLRQRNSTTTKSEVRQSISDDNRHGFCQNDHGGPLLTWIGNKLKVLGVQSVFLLNKQFQCTGPFLYASTSCYGVFIDCILNNGRRSGTDCNASPAVKGFDIFERPISWANHPDGPADNELKRRPTLDIV